MPLLNFKFVMIYIIHEILVLLKNHLNYFKDRIFECFLKEYNRLFFKKKIFFSRFIMLESSSLEEEKIIKDIRNFLN